MFYFPSACVQQFWFQSSSDQNIGIWERARNMPSCQLYRSVSEVPPDNPPRLLQSCVLATGAGWHISCQSRAQNSIVCSNSIMCTKQFVIYTPHTLSRAFFAPQDFVASLHCISPLSPVHKLSAAWRTLDVWTTKPIAFNVCPDKIHRRSN